MNRLKLKKEKPKLREDKARWFNDLSDSDKEDDIFVERKPSTSARLGVKIMPNFSDSDSNEEEMLPLSQIRESKNNNIMQSKSSESCPSKVKLEVTANNVKFKAKNSKFKIETISRGGSLYNSETEVFSSPSLHDTEELDSIDCSLMGATSSNRNIPYSPILLDGNIPSHTTAPGPSGNSKSATEIIDLICDSDESSDITEAEWESYMNGINKKKPASSPPQAPRTPQSKLERSSGSSAGFSPNNRQITDYFLSDRPQKQSRASATVSSATAASSGTCNCNWPGCPNKQMISTTAAAASAISTVTVTRASANESSSLIPGLPTITKKSHRAVKKAKKTRKVEAAATSAEAGAAGGSLDDTQSAVQLVNQMDQDEALARQLQVSVY